MFWQGTIKRRFLMNSFSKIIQNVLFCFKLMQLRSIVNNSDINVIGNSGATTHHINNVSISHNSIFENNLLGIKTPKRKKHSLIMKIYSINS